MVVMSACVHASLYPRSIRHTGFLLYGKGVHIRADEKYLARLFTSCQHGNTRFPILKGLVAEIREGLHHIGFCTRKGKPQLRIRMQISSVCNKLVV